MKKNQCKAMSKIGWVFGQWLHADSYDFVVTRLIVRYHDINALDLSNNKMIVVNGATVCRYTGFDDKDSAMIYERDSVQAYDLDNNLIHEGVVQQINGCWYMDAIPLYELKCNLHLKVIGNIFDNYK